MRALWTRWKRLARFIGDVQARIILTVFYFVVLAPFALVVRIGADPIAMKHGSPNRQAVHLGAHRSLDLGQFADLLPVVAVADADVILDTMHSEMNAPASRLMLASLSLSSRFARQMRSIDHGRCAERDRRVQTQPGVGARCALHGARRRRRRRAPHNRPRDGYRGCLSGKPPRV